MPVTRSDLLFFFGGLAAGATAYATYPKWKDKVSPLISGAMAGVAAAYQDASAATEGTTDESGGECGGRSAAAENVVAATVPFSA
jgi:hypothetical protein